MSQTNMFKFGLYLNDQPILEEGFDRQSYSRNDINLKHVAPNYLRKFKNALSANNHSLTIDKHLKTYKELSKLYKISDEENITTRNSLGGINEEGYYQNSEENFKFILFNVQEDSQSIVIERNFNVKMYNPNTRFSYELLDTFREIVEDIKNQLKIRDYELLLEKFDYRNSFREENNTTVVAA